MSNHRHFLPALLVVFALAPVACGRKAAPPGRPPMPVEGITLEEKPVEQITEFVGTVKSRRSSTVQPQVEGFITKIFVKSGAKVRPGTPLMQIDAGMQAAAVASLESTRAAREADLQYARQQAERMKRLLAAGASSQAEMDQAETALRTSEAQLRAVEAQIREQRVSLGYHRVVAPTAGVVGDVPVRVGDSVERSTVLTTIDQNAGLEVYINVPVQEAHQLKPGLSVHLVDDKGGKITTEKISFVSSSVEEATQAILAKAVLREPGNFRTDQFVRCRIVWTEAPALTVPVVSLNRINGVFFAYVAETKDGKTVARQRGVETGAVVGNDYVIKSGLKPGETLIVSGIQKIADGAPVQVGPPKPPPANPTPPAAALATGSEGE